ncbi:GPCR kinase [Tanacetum coccineum]
MKDLLGTIPGTIHYKVIGEGGYGKDITVEAALILANVSIFSAKPSTHYLNITKRNVVKVFSKDTVLESDNKTNQSNPLTPEKPPMPLISSYLTIEESAEDYDTGDEYLTEGYLIEKEQQQLALDEEALRETLEEEARAEKERARAEKE